MVQVTRSQVVMPDRDTIAVLREQFAQQHHVLLPDFLEKPLLDYATQRLQTAAFYPNVHHMSTRELAREQSVEPEEPVVNSFFFLLNRPRLFEIIQQITDCPTIGSFIGRFYCVHPNSDYFMDWHSDYGKAYVVGLTINLTPEAYSGGVFQLRDGQSHEILHEISHPGFGTAHVFRLASALEHRVTPTTGDVSRLAYSGWFCTQPHYSAYVRRMFKFNPSGHETASLAPVMEPELVRSSRPHGIL